MSYYTVAISSSNHDSCICVMEDATILASWQCERVSRDKHTQKISQSNIQVIKQYTDHIDCVVCVNVYDDTIVDTKLKTFDRLPKSGGFMVSESLTSIKHKLAKAGIKCDKFIVDNNNHHLYHATTGFYTSGFEQALCIVMDGVGSGWAWESGMLSETTTIFFADSKFKTLYKNLHYKATDYGLTGWGDGLVERIKKLFNYSVDISPNLDIGKMYGTVTRHIGFKSSTQAGKTMGLAAYGKSNNLPPMLLNNNIVSDANFFRNDSQLNTFVYPSLINPSENVKKNLAYNVQRAAETIFVKRVEQALNLRPCNNIVIGGGCALNILANSVLKKSFPNINFYIEPIASDASQAMGAALFHYKRIFPSTKYKKLDHIYFGPEYSMMNVKDKLLKLVEQYNNESDLPVNSNPQ